MLTPELRAQFHKFLLRMTLMDDLLMRCFFRNNFKATQAMLQIILDRDDLVVTSVEVQSLIGNPQGRGIVLDIVAIDEMGNTFNVEVQRSYTRASPERLRYYAALIDANKLTKGDAFEQLTATYIIFLMDKDPFKLGFPMYRYEVLPSHCDAPYLNFGLHFIYLNGDYRGDDRLGRLLDDFHTVDPLAIRTPEFRESFVDMKRISSEMETEMLNDPEFVAFVEQFEARGEARGVAIGEARGVAIGEARGRVQEFCEIVNCMREMGVSEEVLTQLRHKRGFDHEETSQC